jgi:hypothetical protein
MTPRSIRRSQDRKARKLARKQARLDAIETNEIESGTCAEAPNQLTLEEPNAPNETLAAGAAGACHQSEIDRPATPARIASAPHPNPGRSTGPKTPEGKAKSCLNAVKTGLTGRTVLLASDDADRYRQHVTDFFDELRPVGPRESALVQSVADSTWRLNRISTLEMALFARGREEFADAFADREPAIRPSLIELHTLLTYEKQIRNLNIQEARLQRQREKDLSELRNLQQERATREQAELEYAAKLYLAAKKDGAHFDPADLGFEFSTEDVVAFLNRVRAAGIARASMQNDIRMAAEGSVAA